mmetsp:Transcript_52229/g.124530  ORF Transcript_52229/g.124530 Transcript_52229/m.124530 type:complete len:413 (-) Transcript_52229:88-1326(-)
MAAVSPQPPRSSPVSARSTPLRAASRTTPRSARASPLQDQADGPRSARAQAEQSSLDRWLTQQLSMSTFVSSNQESSRSIAGGGGAGARGSKAPGPTSGAQMPELVLFPTDKPSSRADAVILDRWIGRYLRSYAERARDDDITGAVEHLVPILSIGLNEVVRQVTQTCAERGIVLEKIWRTYVELFDRALKQCKASLQKHRDKTGRFEVQVSRTHKELADAQARNPEQTAKLAKTLGDKFAARVVELEEHLLQLKAENGALQQKLEDHNTMVGTWFPLFANYKDSPVAKDLAGGEPFAPESNTPEAGIAMDFKRILSVLPEERRRRVGFFVSSLLGLRASAMSASQETLEALVERRDHNRRKLSQLEQRLRELKKPRSLSPERLPSKPQGIRHSKTSIGLETAAAKAAVVGE